MNNKTQAAVTTVSRNVWWQRLWAVLPAAMLSCGLFLAASSSLLYAPSAEAATSCSGGTDNYSKTGSPNNCKLWCQTQANFLVAPWSTKCVLPAGAGFCNDSTMIGGYPTGRSWFVQCGLTTPAMVYGNALANTWCKNTANFTNVHWAVQCKPNYCADPAIVGTANFFNTNGCASGGVYVAATTKAWCDMPANYGTAAWNTYCKTPYCAAGANVGTASWFATNTCGAPTPYTSATTASWCKNSANFGNANWTTYCRASYCADSTQVSAAGGVWFTGCGLTPATAYANATAKAFCDNTANFSSVVGSNWDTYCRSSYCTAPANVGTANFFNTNGCAAGGVYVNPTTKTWCLTLSNAGTANWNTYCKTPVCTDATIIGTLPWFQTTTCGGPTVYTSAITGPWCKNPANFGHANWGSQCGLAYCTDQTQGAVAGGAWFTRCGGPTPYTAPDTSTWCQNAANFGTANWITYCQAGYCADGTKIGTAAWFGTNTCAAGGVYTNATTKAWCDTPANYSNANWATYCRAGYCSAPANAGADDWFLASTCAVPNAYTSPYIATWCKTPANFTDANWHTYCEGSYCVDQTQGAVAGGAWFTACANPTPYTTTGSTGTWCQNVANYGSTNWQTYCKAEYCTDPVKIGTAAWFGANTCGAPAPYTSPDTGTWCNTPANYDTANWNTYCKTGYCADTTQGDVNIVSPTIPASPANWFSRCASATGAYADPDTRPWCADPANFSSGNAAQWQTYCNPTTTGWCYDSANYADANWISNCNNTGGWCDAYYDNLYIGNVAAPLEASSTVLDQWFTACQATVCQSRAPTGSSTAAQLAVYDKNCGCSNIPKRSSLSCSVGVASLAQYPLELGAQVAPNLLIVQDNSGSMDWGFITDYPNGVFHPGRVVNAATGVCTPSCSGEQSDAFFYPFRSPGQWRDSGDYSYVLWPNELDEAIVGQTLQPPAGWTGVGKGPWGFWRGRNADFNKIYYNPNTTYYPWKGIDVNGTPFANALPTAAPVDPYRPTTGGTMNLTLTKTDNALTGFKDANGTNWSAPAANTPMYLPTYYLWTDTNTAVPADAGNGKVDPKDTHVKVEIKAATPTYTVTSARKDCAVVAAGGTTCTYTEEIQNFANWFTYYRDRNLMSKGAMGESIWPQNKLRMGVSFISASGGSRITEINTTPLKNSMLQSLYSQTGTSSGTPLRTALDKAGKSFQCATGDIFGSTTATLPGNINLTSTSGCPIMAPTSAAAWNKGQGKCQQNYSLLMTDGFWNDSLTGFGNIDGGATATNYNGGAFADTASNTLSDVAMHYYQTDLWGTLANEVPTTPTDRLWQVTGTAGGTMHQHMGTYTIGFGIKGSLTSAQVAAIKATPTVAASPAWPTPVADELTTTDDLTHAAFNGRGEYLNAANSSELQTSLAAVFDGILAGSSSATRLTFNTQNLSTNTVAFSASFNTVENTGDLTANVIDFTCAPSTSGPTCPLIKSIGAQQWSAAAQLDGKVTDTTSNRVLVTYNRVSGKAVPFTPAAYALASGTNSWSAMMKTTLTSDMVHYLRGERGYEVGRSHGGIAGTMRARPATSGLLGDIVNSSPQYVGAPAFSNRDGWELPTVPYSTFKAANASRTPLVYVGANDGILHAFDAVTGSEVFGYVPGHLFDVTASAETLDKLTQPSYQHHFYIDLAPVQQDVFYGGAWHSILVGGFRAGGKGYFALDVTNPPATPTEANVISSFLWERTDVEDTDMGYSFSHPAAGFFNDGGTYVAVGNGYGSANNEAVLILMSVAPNTTTGQPSTIKKIHTGAFGTGFGSQPLNGLGDIRAVDLNSDGATDLVYAGDYLGNVWRFDVRSTSSASWTAHKIFTAVSSGGGLQPVVTRPLVVPHPDTIVNGQLGVIDKVVVMFSSGTYMFKTDGTDTDEQSVYGIQDHLVNSTSPAVTFSTYATNRSRLVEQTHTTGLSGSTITRSLSSNPSPDGIIDFTINDGWFVDLNDYRTGERAIREMFLVGSRAFTNTEVPPVSSECTINVGGFTLSFNPWYGTGTSTPFFDLNHDGVINASDLNADGTVPSGFAIMGNIPGEGSSICGTSTCTLASDGEMTDVAAGLRHVVGRVSWKELNN